MNPLSLRSADEKTLRLTGISPVLAHCLFELPEILRLRDQPAPRRRLLQDPSPRDVEANAEWHRLIDGELQHLFASAGETVARDLTQLDPASGQLDFPADHANAWMSALNQARLILGAQCDVTETDMEREDLDVRDPRHKALVQIHLLGWVLHLFIDHDDETAV